MAGVEKDHIHSLVGLNPILVTTLNPLIGYDLASKIANVSSRLTCGYRLADATPR